MQFDYNTLLIIIACLNMVYLIMSASIMLSENKPNNHIYWVYGFAMLLISHISLAFLEVIPFQDLILMVTNIFILTGFISIIHGLMRFAKFKSRIKFFVLLIFLMICANILFIYAYPNAINRRLSTSLLMAILSLYALYFFWYEFKKRKHIGWLILCTTAFLGFIMYTLRIWDTLFADNHAFFNQTIQNLIMALGFFVINLLLGVGILDLINQKRIDVYRNQINIHETLLSSIGHDIKEPLAHIYQLSNLFNSSIDKPNFPVENVFGKIETLSFNANHLAHNLLNWIRLNKDELKVQVENTNVNTVLQEEISLYQPIGDIKNVQLRFEGCNHIKEIDTDVNMFKLIVRNLINNAVKYSQENSFISCFVIENNNVIQIVIKDKGKGIPKEKLQHLNNPKELQKQRNQNIGIQLCHWYVNRLNGKLIFDSEIGIGSTATIELPSN